MNGLLGMLDDAPGRRLLVDGGKAGGVGELVGSLVLEECRALAEFVELTALVDGAVEELEGLFATLGTVEPVADDLGELAGRRVARPGSRCIRR